MYLLILVIVTVSARDIYQADYNYESPRHERFDKQFDNPPLETNQRPDNGNYQSPNEHLNLNNREFSASNDREIYANDRNDRGRNIAHLNQGRSHDNTERMNVNLAFDRPDNQHSHKQSNLNIPRQSFNNNEHRNRDKALSNVNQNNSHKYNDNILQARRRQDEMIFADNNNKKTQKETNQENNSPFKNNVDIVTFLNNVNNNTNKNENRRNQNKNNNRGNQGSFKSTDIKEYEPKTTIENEVTPNRMENGEADKEWVWGVVETTTTGPNVTLDDRAAFTGDKCATGMVRVMGRCVEED